MLSDIAKQKIISELYDEEGYRQFAYDDATAQTVKAPKGNLTFGIGWNIQLNGCPKPIAEFATLYFINKFDQELSESLDFYNSLDDVRKVVLCDMAYQMGVGGELSFVNVINCLRQKDYHGASVAMLDSDWARRFVKRATKLSKMMDSGQWT